LARAGAAQVVDDARLEAELTQVVIDLLVDPARRRRMGEAAAGLARPDAAYQIAQELLRLGATHA
jgi:UDP-N-acetylglucosamine:LPS N-acetylglucosamine transferase